MCGTLVTAHEPLEDGLHGHASHADLAECGGGRRNDGGAGDGGVCSTSGSVAVDTTDDVEGEDVEASKACEERTQLARRAERASAQEEVSRMLEATETSDSRAGGEVWPYDALELEPEHTREECTQGWQGCVGPRGVPGMAPPVAYGEACDVRGERGDGEPAVGQTAGVFRARAHVRAEQRQKGCAAWSFAETHAGPYETTRCVQPQLADEGARAEGRDVGGGGEGLDDGQVELGGEGGETAATGGPRLEDGCGPPRDGCERRTTARFVFEEGRGRGRGRGRERLAVGVEDGCHEGHGSRADSNFISSKPCRSPSQSKEEIEHSWRRAWPAAAAAFVQAQPGIALL